MAGAFTGTGALARLALRRDRVQLPVWLVGIPVVAYFSAAATVDIYGGEAGRLSYATTTAANVVARAFNGPASGTAEGTAAYAETFLTVALLTALTSTFAVVRHTRQNEETGRAEMIRAAVVGRHAPLAAALVVVFGTDLLLGGLLALAYAGTGLPLAGSLATGAGFGAIGAAFAAVAAVTAQVFESARAANGAAAGVLGVAFALRATGDSMGELREGGTMVASAWPSWLSPLGWAQQIRPFQADHWWILGLFAAFVVILVAVAVTLTNHRDFGTGLLTVRPGPAAAGRGLRSPLGLAWRLQRGTLLGWLIAYAALAVPMGTLGTAVEDLLGDNEQAAQMLQDLGGGVGTLVDTFLAAMLGIFALTTGAYAVQALLRLRAEETAGTLEPLLATAVGRPRWMAGHVLCALGGVAALTLVAGLGLGLGYGLAAGDVAGQVGRIGAAALAQVPAVLVVAGFVVVVFALLPRFAVALSWAALVACMLLGQIGVLLRLPQAVLDVSPFTHVPAAPASPVTATPLVALAVVAVLLAALGFGVFRRRDLTL